MPTVSECPGDVCFVLVYADYSDLRGDPPTMIKADDFVELRREAFNGLKTQHLSTNHLVTVTGDGTTCVSSMVIHRRLFTGQEERRFDTHCYYTHTLVRTTQGWKICKVKQTVLWNTGDSRIHAGVRNCTAAN